MSTINPVTTAKNCADECMSVAQLQISQAMALLLLILSIAGILSAEDNYLPTSLTVTVSENGTDTPQCLASNHCKTLDYVLAQISIANFPATNNFISVNVTYNQSITTESKCNFSALRTPLYLEVTVFGTNQPFINCEINSSLVILAGIETSILWVWKDLVFAGCGLLTGSAGSSIPGLRLDLASVVFLQCTILTSYLYISNTKRVVISETSFGNEDENNGHCPLVLAQTSSREFTSNFFFLHNTFSNCQVSSSTHGILILYSYSHVIISNSTFSRVHDNLKPQPTAAIITGYNTINVTITANVILNNSLSFLYLYNYVDFTVETVAQCTIQQNKFLQNMGTAEISYQRMSLIHLCPTGTITIHFLGNYFYGNTMISMAYIYRCGNKNLTIVINETNITNNNASMGLISVEKGTPRYGAVNVTIRSLTAEGNVVYAENEQASTGLQSSIVRIVNVDQVLMSEINCSKNLGTPLLLQSDEALGQFHLVLSGNFLFDRNIGLYGGACALQNVIINAIFYSTLIFERNFGTYGGALYLENAIISQPCNMTVEFINNNAITSGNSVYFATSPLLQESQCKLSLNISDVSSLATNISFIPNNENSTSLSIFPGQNIVINISITDYFGSPSSCTADAYLLCDNSLYTCIDKQIKLKGPENVVLVQTANTTMSTVDTNLKLSLPQDAINSTTVTLVLTCRNAEHTKTKIPLKITNCSLGFFYNPKESVCKCEVESSHFICSTKVGAACVSHGYWYGPAYTVDNTSVYTVAKCSFPECRYSYTLCPPAMQAVSSFVLLGFDADRQCSEGRGGVLCKSCANQFEFSFISVKCVSVNSCSWWQPVVILSISFLFQILFAVMLIFVVRFKLTLGSGILYGPMQFLAVINHLPLENYPEYSELSTMISVIASVPLLNLELFGFVPWCFIPSSSKLFNYSLSYLGPLAVLMVILLVSLVARWCPNALRRWQSSPLKAMCILMLLSFWSLADTSFDILTFNKLSFISGTSSIYVVAMQPKDKFFSIQHLPVAIPALLVLLVVITPLLVVLLCSPVLSKIINLHRIKPFLDEFHSCYKDRYRWYSGVYFLGWIVIVAIHGNESITIPVIQTIFFILMTAHVLIQPYQSRLLNFTDILLLMDLNFLIVLMQSTYLTSPIVVILIHTLVIGPLLCFVVCFSCVCIIKCGVYDYLHNLWIWRRQHSKDEQQHNEVHEQPPPVPVQDVWCEREPLIGIINDN